MGGEENETAQQNTLVAPFEPRESSCPDSVRQSLKDMENNLAQPMLTM